MGNVTFDLSKENFTDATVYRGNDLLHQSKLQQIKSIWKELYAKALQHNDINGTDEILSRCHNAVSITGSRGAGKTTFLLSVLDYIKSEYGKDVLCLNPIDPSLVEMKQHPFINIIAAIQEYVSNYFNCVEYANSRSSILYCKKEFDDCYRNLLMALPFIDGVGKPRVYDEWDDEEFIALQGMERAAASNNLEVLFHRYVNVVLKILNKKCIVISFDDIDTDFKKGYDVLESIRKYLTTSQIITFITGDLELYGKLVRKSSWKCFDLPFLKKEIEYANRDKKEFSQMVDQLENQYLVKLLKPEYRVVLKTIREYLFEEKYKVDVCLSNGVTMDIRALYNTCVSMMGLGNINNKTKNEIVVFLLGLTLRVQIRIITLLNNILSQKGINSSVPNSDMANGMLNVFWNDLNQKSSNAKALMKASSTYTVEMLKFLIENKILFHNTNFLPETNDFTINKVLLVIGAQFNQVLSKNSFLIFDYWMRICYVKVALEKIGSKGQLDLINHFIDFAQLDADAGLNKSYGLSQAFINSQLNPPFYNKHDCLPGVAFIGDQSPAQLMEANKYLALLPLLGTVDSKREEHAFASIFQLLTVVREVLFVINSGSNTRWSVELSKLAQYRNYQEPFVAHQEPIDLLRSNEDFDFQVQFVDSNMSLIKPLLKQINEWANTEVNVSCQLLDRVFTRFYYTLIHIDLNKRKFGHTVGDVLSLYIISLLNAALIEDAIDSGYGFMNYNNVGDIEVIYIDNLERYYSYSLNKVAGRKGYAKRHAFYDWLSKCPILNIFINPYILSLQEYGKKNPNSPWANIIHLDRIVEHIKQLEIEKNTLDEEIAKCNKNKEWMMRYFQWKDLENELSIEMQFIHGQDDGEHLKLLKEKVNKKNKLQHELESCEGWYTYRTSRTIIEQAYDDELKRFHDLTQKSEKISDRLRSLSINKQLVIDILKEEKEKFDSFNDGEYASSLLKFNEYKELCNIKIDEV